MPLISYYENKGLLTKISCNGTKEEIYDNIKSILRRHV